MAISGNVVTIGRLAIVVSFLQNKIQLNNIN